MRVARERCLRLPAVLCAGCWLAGSFPLNVYSTSRCDPESPHPRGRALINHDLFSSRLRTSIPPGYLCILTATCTMVVREPPTPQKDKCDSRMGYRPVLRSYTCGPTCLDADEARRTRRRGHCRLRTQLCVQETWFPQGYVQRQTATYVPALALHRLQPSWLHQA
jgi:hypothetical protein